MKTPRDQGLFFTVFFSITFTATLAAWLLIPAHVKHDEGDGAAENRPKKILKGQDAILESEAVLAKADEILTRLEKTQKTDKTKDAKINDAKGKDEKTKDGKTPKPPDKKPVPDKK